MSIQVTPSEFHAVGNVTNGDFANLMDLVRYSFTHLADVYHFAASDAVDLPGDKSHMFMGTITQFDNHASIYLTDVTDANVVIYVTKFDKNEPFLQWRKITTSQLKEK